MSFFLGVKSSSWGQNKSLCKGFDNQYKLNLPQRFPKLFDIPVLNGQVNVQMNSTSYTFKAYLPINCNYVITIDVKSFSNVE